MALLRSVLGLMAVSGGLVKAAIDDGDKTEMGPAAFMWPKDRVWSAAMDNTAPCGSSAKPGERSQYPLEGAKIALVGQDDSYDIQLSIAYMDNPTKNSDFEILIDADEWSDIDPGHTCVPVKDVPASIHAGRKATLQIKYIADFDKPENQTFYACADVNLVEPGDFSERIPCFNSTKESGDTENTSGDDWYHGEDGEESKKTSTADSDAKSTSSSDSAKASGTSDDDKEASSGGGGGLSKGAIAGIVVGSVVGVALIAGLVFLWYRQSSKKLSIMRQQNTSRGVNWEMQPPKDNQSGTSSVRNENPAV